MYLVLKLFILVVIWASVFGVTFLPYWLVTRQLKRKKAFSQRGGGGRLANYSDENSGLILSFSSCFAAGVFLSTCFLALVPHVRHHFDAIEQRSSQNAGPTLAKTDSGGLSNSGLIVKKGVEIFGNQSGDFSTASLNDVTNTGKLSLSQDQSSTSHGSNFPITELLLIVGFILTMALEQLFHMCHASYSGDKSSGAKKINSHGGGKAGFQSGGKQKTLLKKNSKLGAINDKGGYLSENLLDSSNDSDSDLEDTFVSVFDSVSRTTANKTLSDNQGDKKLITPSHSAIEFIDGGVEIDGICGADGAGSIPSAGQLLHHDHAHDHSSASSGHAHSHALVLEPDGSFTFAALALMFGLSTHSVFEGLALGLQDTRAQFMSMLIGLTFHELLCAATFGITLAKNRVNLRNSIIIVFLYSTTLPFGMALGLALEVVRGAGMQLIKAVLEGIASGTFVYVTCMEMLPEEFAGHHQRAGMKLVKTGFVAIGVVVFLGIMNII